MDRTEGRKEKKKSSAPLLLRIAVDSWSECRTRDAEKRREENKKRHLAITPAHYVAVFCKGGETTKKEEREKGNARLLHSRT